ncbi:hypothetical protein BGZ73_002842 [Actinomortierella ambigua]|nr:hypothetical protein BGZ73_002842 [Actinomortierella ambigua]
MRLPRLAASLVATAAWATVAFARPELVVERDSRMLIQTSNMKPEGKVGFYIQRGPSDADVLEWEAGCLLDNPYFQQEISEGRSTFEQIPPESITSGNFNYSHTVEKGEEELWSFFFLNCLDSEVSFRLTTTEVNPGQCFLSAGDIPLPRVYTGAAIAYFVAGSIWLYMLTRKDTRVFWPHRLILILAVLIGCHKVFQAIKFSYLRQGIDPEAMTVMSYIFAFLRGSLSILIITLIASGWMFVKPFLTNKDKKIIGIIIPLQILSNIATTISNEAAIGSANWSFWTQLFPLVDLISCVVILGVIIQTQRHLGEAAEAEGKGAENKRKYKLWGSFYLITVVYIYLTRILVEFLKVALPFQYVTWLVEVLNEAITLGFYASIGWKFRPYANNPYTLIDEDDLDDVEAGTTGSENVGLQTMSRRERQGDRDE